MDSSDVENTEDKTYFKIENITVVRPPLLKVYYWRCLDIQGYVRLYNYTVYV